MTTTGGTAARRSGQPNLDPEGCLIEPDHPEYGVLVFADFLHPAQFTAHAAVPGLKLLQAEYIDDLRPDHLDEGA